MCRIPIFIRKYSSFSFIFNGKTQKKNLLGRWSTDKNPNEIHKQIIWANHDHCGGDLCRYPDFDNNLKNKNEILNDGLKESDDYYLPYVI